MMQCDVVVSLSVSVLFYQKLKNIFRKSYTSIKSACCMSASHEE